MVEKDEFNEYGVRQNVSKEKIKNSPNYSMIIIVTVLFSIFNFVVGYMIGKFLGSSQKPAYSSSIQESRYEKVDNIDSVVGLPSSNYSSKKSSANTVDVSDLENDLTDNFVLENKDSSLSSNKSSSTEGKNENSVSLKSVNKQVSSTSKPSQKIVSEVSTKKTSSVSTSKVTKNASSSSTGKIYYVQVSANENKDVAQGTLQKLNSMGIKNASIINVTVGNKNIYRVRIGAFSSYEEANKALEIARKVNKDAFIVVSTTK
jgi:cell division septation protein DedD